MKRIVQLLFILFLVQNSFGQDVPSITFTTSKSPGSTIRLSVQGDQDDRSDMWIDLDNNGVRDEGEDIVEFGPWSGGNSPLYTIESQTITIYGKVKQFGAGQGELTEINVTNNPHITYLWLLENKLEYLDLSSQTEDVYFLHLAANQLKELDVSRFTKLQQLNIDRNNLQEVTMGHHPDLFQLNISRNYFSEEAIDELLEILPDNSGSTEGRFYVIDTRASWSQYPEGNRLKQRHLDHQALTRPDNAGYNWFSRDVNSSVDKFSDITLITNRYNMSFSTRKNVGDQLSMSIDADPTDQPAIWIDLNGNGLKDSGEELSILGSEVSYSLGAQNITVYGPVSHLSAGSVEMTELDASANPFLISASVPGNYLTGIKVSEHQPLEDLDVSLNHFTTDKVEDLIESLMPRNNLSPGFLTLINLDLEETNEIIREHVNLANSKNWEVTDADGNILARNDIPLLEQSLDSLTKYEIYPGGEIILPAQTDQGLPLTYFLEDASEPLALINSNKVTALREGELEISAFQSGDENHLEFSTAINVTILPASEVFSWLEMPAISVIGDVVTIVGPEDFVSQFTKLYVNDELVEMNGGVFVLSDEYTGELGLRATNADGSQEIRIFLEK